MRYPKAVWYPGNNNKQYIVSNRCLGIVAHSMEGYINYALQEVVDPSISLSWPFSVCKDGTVYQHYELEASCWCNGNYWANTNYIGVEHEGVSGEPLTEVQLQASIDLFRWISEVKGWPLQRHVTMFEHNEVVLLSYPNAGPTSCPNNRIPWNRYTEDDEVKITNLDQTESIYFVNRLVAHVAEIIGDNNGCSVLELETPSIPLAPGYKLYGIVVKDTI